MLETDSEEENSKSSYDVIEYTSVDDKNMFVRNREESSKKLFCMFCNRFQSKFARHIEKVHSDNDEVKKFIALPKGSKERRKIIDTIKKNCQFAFNTNIFLNDGELIVSRRPTQNNKRATDYQVCQNCRGFFTKTNIRHHAKHCFSYCGRKNRTLFVMGKKILKRIHPEASNVLKNQVFPVLREDDIVRNIRYDRLIILYGNKMCNKYRWQHQQDMIRANLRLLGRFLIILKEKTNNILEFADLYDPTNYDVAVSSINVVAGFDDVRNTYEAPSTAYNLGSLIKKICYIHISDCIKQKNSMKKQNAEDFLKLLIEDIPVSVNKTVLETQTQQYRRKKVNLPRQEDIQKLNTHLKRQRKLALDQLNIEFNQNAWLTLAETTLISLQLFNRRRAGEIERIFIDDYNTRTGIDKDLLKSLSPNSKRLAENYVRFVIRGKLNRTVPVLMSKEIVDSIEILLKHRRSAGVRPENRYLFGVAGMNKLRSKYLRSCTLMRKFATECGAVFPLTLRGTTLRKHIATNCINLNLSESEIADVANFMGHSDKIHKEHYRQPILTREILRMSRVLQLAQGESDSDLDEDGEDYVDSHKTSYPKSGKTGFLHCSA